MRDSRIWATAASLILWTGVYLEAKPRSVRPAIVAGTQLVVTKEDGTKVTGKALEGAIIVGFGPGGREEAFKIAKIEKDAKDPDGDVFLYRFQSRDPQTGEWQDTCPPDA